MYKLWIYHRNSRVSAFASPCAAISCFLCIKAKQLHFHSSSLLALLPHVCFAFIFSSPKLEGKKKKKERHLN